MIFPDITARGKYLDNLGELYGVKREPEECDEKYRDRITKVVNEITYKQKLRSIRENRAKVGER